jgi:hypothetical protein
VGEASAADVARARLRTTTARIVPATKSAANGVTHASQLKPCIVGDDSTFSPSRSRNAARICSFDSPRASRSAISFFIGSPEPHWRWLQECTVSPQPH